jgi:LacI family transcriptional regulator
MSKKQITIYDLAEKLNISATTVSRGLQNHPAINKNTKKKIFDLAETLGYQSNKFASNLRKQKTHTIGVIVPRLNSLFMSSVLSGIEKIVNNAGYNLIISQSFEHEDKEKTNVATMFSNRVDGLIVSLSADTTNYNHFNTFIKKGIPLILFDRVTDKIPGTKIIIDNKRAGYLATKHLIEQGSKDILHITGSLNRNVYQDRFEGYKKALAEHQIPFKEELFISNDLSEQAILECFTNDILKRKKLPDGLFISNDSSAAFALTILKEAGVKVPQDLAIVGFNNDLISKVTEPAISTIDYPGNEMGESIARILINHLDGQGDLSFTSTVILNSELIIRDSSRRIK